jgi:TolB protein
MQRFTAAVSRGALLLFFFAHSAAAEDVPRLTIATKRFGGVQLMSIGIDGSRPAQLTKEPNDATQPTWCPDGSKLAYVIGPTQQGRIKIMDADGTNAHYLFEGEGSQRTPQWSPDGKQIAFSMTTGPDSNYDIFVANADGTGLKNLTNSPIFEADPGWSPDSKQITFARADDGQFPRVWVMNADGTEQMDVSRRTLNVAVYPTWTSDGKQITFGATDESGTSQITQMNADGSGNTVLTHAPKPHSYAAWSPDGQYLAYVSEPGAEKGDLCIYETLTGAHRVVLKEEVFQELFRDARPSWEPKRSDGK